MFRLPVSCWVVRLTLRSSPGGTGTGVENCRGVIASSQHPQVFTTESVKPLSPQSWGLFIFISIFITALFHSAAHFILPLQPGSPRPHVHQGLLFVRLWLLLVVVRWVPKAGAKAGLQQPLGPSEELEAAKPSSGHGQAEPLYCLASTQTDRDS